jgi:hypothetical protein
MRDFIFFRRMIMPILLQILFWISVLLCIITGIADFFNHKILVGLQIIILGPILARISCEFLILFFRMNETLTDIKNQLADPENPEAKP